MIKTPYIFWRGRYSPLTEIEVFNDDKSIRTLAYIDTGATYCIAPFETIEKIGYEPANSKEIIPINTASGLIHAPLVRIKSLNVLGKVVENVEILCHNIPNVSRIEGLLGLNYLKHFKLTIDFPKGTLALE